MHAISVMQQTNYRPFGSCSCKCTAGAYHFASKFEVFARDPAACLHPIGRRRNELEISEECWRGATGK